MVSKIFLILICIFLLIRIFINTYFININSRKRKKNLPIKFLPLNNATYSLKKKKHKIIPNKNENGGG